MSWSDIFIPAGNQTSAEQDANYARLQQQNADRLAARQAADTITAQQVGFNNSNQDALLVQDQAAAAGFIEGAKQGLNNVLDAPGNLVGGVGSGLSQVLGGVLKNIPWWVYLVAAGALFVWMGGLALIRGRLAR